MAYVIVKNEQRQADERRVAQTFGANMAKAESRELVEHVAARSREAYAELKHMEDR